MAQPIATQATILPLFEFSSMLVSFVFDGLGVCFLSTSGVVVRAFYELSIVVSFALERLGVAFYVTELFF